MSVLNELFTELHLLLASHGVNPSPKYHGWDAYILRKHIDFEPNGRASETWEYTWFLELPWCKHYWRSTTGWRRGTYEGGMVFHRGGLQTVIGQTSRFLMDMTHQGVKLGDDIREKNTPPKTQDQS